MPIIVALVAGVITLAAADPKPLPDRTPTPPAAASAARHGVEASARAPTPGHGYSERARRQADCLATYPGYDPKTDMIRTPSGAARRCTL